MFGVFESIRKACSHNDGHIEYDAENVGEALVIAHNYLHNTLLAGNFSQVDKRVERPVVKVIDAESDSVSDCAS